MENGPERYMSDEVVVALTDRDVVRSVLLSMKDVVAADLDDDRSDETLGLGMIRLKYSAGSRLGSTDATYATGEDADPSALGRLLDEVRAKCREDFGGWQPTIGKNRVLRVEGVSGYVGGGGSDDGVGGNGDGYPTPVDGAAGLIDPASDKGRGVRVAVLDTGLVPHRELAGRYIANMADLLDEERDRHYMAGHATFVAGVILHHAPAAEIRLHRVLDDDAVATTWDLARKMVEFAGSDVSVLNLSLGCFTYDNLPPLLLQRAVQVLAPTIVIVAAAGNHGLLPTKDSANGRPTRCSPMWPAAFSDVVAVAARDQDGIAPFSPRLPWVDFTAPGVDIVSTYLSERATIERSDGNGGVITSRRKFGGYATWSGSSFAAAAVSGEIAARTVPGRTTVREVLRELRGTLGDIIPYRCERS